MLPWPIAAVIALVAAVDAGAGGDAATTSDRDGRAPDAADAADAGDAARDGGTVDARDGGAADAAVDLAPAPLKLRLGGLVLEKGTRRPLVGAVVTLDGAAAGETDAHGRFELQAPPGTHHLQIQLSGHDAAERRVHLAAGAVHEPELFRLAPRLTGERYETTVRTGRPEIARVDVAGDEARAVAGTSGDPLRVIG